MTLLWAYVACWWSSPDCVDFFIRVWSITLLLEHIFVVFLIFRRCMVRHLWFSFLLDSHTLYQMDYFRDRRPCCSYVSLGVPITLSWCILGVPWHVFFQLCLLWVFRWKPRSVFSGSSWARLIGASSVFFGALPFLASFLDSLLLQGYHICWESSMDSRTAWSWPYCLRQGIFLTLFVTFPLEVLILLLKALE